MSLYKRNYLPLSAYLVTALRIEKASIKMKQDIKKLIISLLVMDLCMILVLEWNVGANVIFGTDQMTKTPTFSLQESIFPLTVINPVTDEYILYGTWNIDVSEGRVINFKADMVINDSDYKNGISADLPK
jgi:hypothetical protein